MKRNRFFVVYALTLGALVPAVFLARESLADRQPQAEPFAILRESAYRENNIGVALLEQFKYKEGAEAFKRALKIDSKLSLAHINLSIALYNVPDLPAAEREAKVALTFAPNAPQPYYVLGMIAKINKPQEAVTAFQHVLEIDANDVGANINLGQIYGLGQALLRTNQRDEGLAVTQRFKELRERGSATGIGNTYLEQGRDAEAVASTGAEAELVDRTTPSVTFTDATAATFSSLADSAASAPSSPVSLAIFGHQFKSSELNDATRREIEIGR